MEICASPSQRYTVPHSVQINLEVVSFNKSLKQLQQKSKTWCCWLNGNLFHTKWAVYTQEACRYVVVHIKNIQGQEWLIHLRNNHVAGNLRFVGHGDGCLVLVVEPAQFALILFLPKSPH